MIKFLLLKSSIFFDFWYCTFPSINGCGCSGPHYPVVSYLWVCMQIFVQQFAFFPDSKTNNFRDSFPVFEFVSLQNIRILKSYIAGYPILVYFVDATVRNILTYTANVWVTFIRRLCTYPRTVVRIGTFFNTYAKDLTHRKDKTSVAYTAYHCRRWFKH